MKTKALLLFFSLSFQIYLLQCKQQTIDKNKPAKIAQTDNKENNNHDSLQKEKAPSPVLSHNSISETHENNSTFIADHQQSNSTLDKDLEKQSTHSETQQSPMPIDKKEIEENSDLPQQRKIIDSMSVIGDSISVGFLSDTEHAVSISPQSPIIDTFTQVVFGADFKDTMQSLSQVYKEQFPSAFVATTDPECISHSCRLGITDKNNLSNLAQVGHRIEDLLESQLPHLKEQEDYIIVSIGANDFCAEDFNTEVFLRSYQNLVKKIDDFAHDPIVLFIPVPDVLAVYRITPADKLSFTFFLNEYTCGDFRDGHFFGAEAAECPRFRNSVFSELHVEEYQTLNREIENIIESYGDPQTMFFAQSLMHTTMKASDLAIDCFHPSLTGHKKLAEESWHYIEDVIDIGS